MNTAPTKTSISGTRYFFRGFDIIRMKGIRRYVLVPLLINIIIFSLAFRYLLSQLDHLMNWVDSLIPSWLDWISYLIWPFAVIAIVVVFSFIFSTAANWLAAPFNGLLSEKVEKTLTNTTKINDDGFNDLIKDIPRTLSREWQKLKYYVPRALGFLLILVFVPVAGEIIWFIFIAWMMAVQYKDYPFDNHKIDFGTMKNEISKNQTLSYSFGLTVTLFSMIPIVNLIVMPVAISGATAIWVDHYRDNYKQ